MEARILGLAEAFDYMTMPPPWAQRVPEGVALEEIRSGSGTLWDPQVVEAFLAIQPIIQPVGL